jgi:hypothetical protein
MTNVSSLSSRLYGRLLLLYPEDLRRDYGADMALVFGEDLHAARQEAGIWGAIRVWRCALAEFFRIALPGCASSPAVCVPAIWLAMSTVTLSAQLAMALRHSPHTPGLFNAILAALLMPASGTPLVSVAVWICGGGNTITSLDLSTHPAVCGSDTILSLDLSNGAGDAI